MPVRLATTAWTTGLLPPTGGTPPWPATPTSRETLAPSAPAEQLCDPVRVSQMRVGTVAWYWYPGAAPAFPNHPFASRTTLMLPATENTHTAVSSPPLVVGP